MTSDRIFLAAFIIAVVGSGILIGAGFPPGEWYIGLHKPWFNPPGWIFGPVWTILYILIGIAGWRNWFRPSDPSLKPLWIVQMALNFAWSPIFFGAHNIGFALVVIIALWLTIVVYLIRSKDIDRVSFFLFLPYSLWVSFATCLNSAIFLLN